MSHRKRHQMQRRESEVELLRTGSAQICKACDKGLQAVGTITVLLPDGILNVECFECSLCGRGYMMPTAAARVGVRPAF